MTETNLYALDGSAPQTIYTPRDANELAETLAECNQAKRAVVPWGGGTLQHLGRMPARYDAVLQTRNLNGVVEYAFDDLTVTVGAGMTLANLDRVLGEHGQFLPVDVPHPTRATIGGVLAAGANGPLRLRYGPARDYMLGLRLATVDGQVLKAGSKVVKNVAGYELHKVQVGALGTLGVLTEATFKVFPKPAAETTVWAAFETPVAACQAIPKLWNLKVPPHALELLDAASAAWVQPSVSGAWHVVVRFGGSKATMAAARELAAQAAAANGARSTEVVDDAGALWRSIAELPATLREQLPAALLVRLSVPPKELPAALGLVADLAAAHKLEPPQMAAHACITSLYAAFSGDTAALGALGELLRTRAHALHGHLVVEHAPPGVQLAPWDEPGASFKLMQAIKRKFDPNNILNPGRFVGGI